MPATHTRSGMPVVTREVVYKYQVALMRAVFDNPTEILQEGTEPNRMLNPESLEEEHQDVLANYIAAVISAYEMQIERMQRIGARPALYRALGRVLLTTACMGIYRMLEEAECRARREDV